VFGWLGFLVGYLTLNKKASHKPTSQRKNTFLILVHYDFGVDFCAVDYHPPNIDPSWQGLCELEAMVHVLCPRPFDQDSGLWIYLIHFNRRSNIQRFQTQKTIYFMENLYRN
jgi:hypothetical protein